MKMFSYAILLYIDTILLQGAEMLDLGQLHKNTIYRNQGTPIHV